MTPTLCDIGAENDKLCRAQRFPISREMTMENESPRLRLSILGIVALSLFGALFARLWFLQVMAAPEFKVEAQANRVRTVTEEAPRGRILDAKGRVIVDNRTSRVVKVDPVELRAMTQAGSRCARLNLAETLTSFGVPTKVSTIDRQLTDTEYNPLQPIPVAIDVPGGTADVPGRAGGRVPRRSR